MAQADTHDGDLRGLHEHLQVVHSGLAVRWVSRAIGDKDTIVVIGHLLNLEIIREDRNTGSTADQASENVLLDTTINQSDVVLGVVRLDNEGGFRANLLDKVNLARIDETLVFVGIVLITNRDSGQGGSLLSEVSDNGTGVNARDGGNAFSGTPCAEALNSSPMTILLGDVGDNHTSTLDMRRLEVPQEVPFVTLRGRHAIVSNQWLREDQDLSSVGRVGHRLRVAYKGSGEDGFAGNVGVGTESSSLEYGSVLHSD